MQVPFTRMDDVIDDYHGRKVADPYRWLEDAQSEETQAWVEAQNAVTKEYLGRIEARRGIIERLTALMNYPRYSVPTKRQGRYFYSKNTGLQNQAIFYMQQGLEGEPQVVLDPNELSSDGTVAVMTTALSEDGTLLAYGLSTSGSDWQEVRIRDLDTGTDYAEVLRWCRFSTIAWKHDNSGFYYNRYPEAGTVAEEDRNNYNRVYWHQLGTEQQEDTLIYERPDVKELGFSPFITEDGKYLVLHVWLGTDPRSRIYYREVESEGAFTRLLDEFDASYSVVGTRGSLFYLHTDLNAPKGRLVVVDLARPERLHWRDVVPEQEEDVLAFALLVNEQFVVVYKRDAHHIIQRYTLEGELVGEIEMPTIGSIVEISGRERGKEFFFSFTSFLYAPSVFRYDFDSDAVTVWQEAKLDFDATGYTTVQVFYHSKDGTRVPMFLTHKKGLERNGENPTLLYGYGGFNQSMTPNFSIGVLHWLEKGGIFAVANLRGGDEYGEEWHQAGMLGKKQNVFDDFIAAAEWLISERYTRTEKLAINGGSNGGLLVAACMVQRPELYGAVVCEVPVIDMLRYHRFTIGRYWIPEYGNAESSREDFEFLYAYSPLHNIQQGVEYPATLILAADTDDRVVPAHAKKFAATLQAAHGGSNPILLKIETKAGHGLGKPTRKVIEARGDVYAFLWERLKIA